MTGPEHDEDFEAYLQRRSVLPHRLSKAERFEPPPELDRIVLERAQEAIRSARPAPVYRPARWALPFGLAATVVIAFAVILHMRPNGNSGALVASRSVPVQTNMLKEAAPARELQKAARMRDESTNAFIASADKPAEKKMPTANAVVLPPNKWLEKITQLRREGKNAEADREVKAFRKAYPNLTVPGENYAR